MRTFIGIDLGGTNINIGLVSENREIMKEEVIQTCPEKGPSNAIRRIATLLRKMIHSNAGFEYTAIGMGLPGLLDAEKGIIMEASNLPGWQQYPIAGELMKELGIPVFIENDANLAALGEQWMGAGKGRDNLFMVTLGSGIGGALLAGGKVLRMHPSAGEFGHMIIEKSGAVCTCGRKGCLETLISRHAFQRIVRERLPDNTHSSLCNYREEDITPLILYAEAVRGDQLAGGIFREAGEALGTALSNVINLTGVSFIIIGGGIANAWEILREPVWRSVNNNVFRAILSGVEICPAILGEKAGFAGAAKMAADAVSAP
jgi:glucokinase